MSLIAADWAMYSLAGGPHQRSDFWSPEDSAAPPPPPGLGGLGLYSNGRIRGELRGLVTRLLSFSFCGGSREKAGQW